MIYFLMKTCFTAFHVVHEFFASFNIIYCCCACASVLSHHGFLGAMTVLGHVVFIWFHFKKRNEMKEKLILKKTIRKIKK